MVKPEWGTKRVCPKCATRFYDLGSADPVTCIACGNAWVPDPVLKSKQPLPSNAPVPVALPEVEGAEPVLGEEDIDLEEEEAAEDADADLGGDDDIADVVDPDKEEER